MLSRFFLILWVIVSFLCVSGAAWAQRGNDADRPPVVTVQVVEEREVNPPAEYVGRVEAIQTVDLRARVDGFLERLEFREGSDVRTGDLLFLIEQAPYQARVNAARARVAETQAILTRARQLTQRLKGVRTGGVSAVDLETAVAEEQQARARLQEARANLEQAELDLGYTTIRAPIDGRIGRAAVTLGNLVGLNSGPLARIVQLDPIRVVYSMSEIDFLALEKVLSEPEGGAKAAKQGFVFGLRLPDGTAYPLEGRIDFVDNEVDPTTGTLAVRAVFENPRFSLLPGRYVTVLVRRKDPARLPMVIQSSVQQDRDGRYVFVVDRENRAVLRRITTGAEMDGYWAVESGLEAGERIIVHGIQKVRDGQIVEPQAAGAPGGA